MPIAAIKKEYLEAVRAIEARLTSMSDEFFHNPEVGLEEWKTSSAMQGILGEYGFLIEKNIAGMPTAFSALLGSGRPKIALLAEMDALPGIGHGCGHNIAGMSSVGAALALSGVLKRHLPPGSGTLCVLGTPAEELGKGKIEMINAGVFKDIDAAMMVHGSSKRRVVKHFLGLIRLNFIFTGRTSHASAYPEEGINALDAVIQTFNAISALRQQLRTDVRIHGIITDGGKAPNIIPERAEASFYVRAGDMKELVSVKERVIRCAEGAAIATGCRLAVVESGECNAPMKINDSFVALYRESLSELGLSEDPGSPEKNVGSSDIGNVSQIVPTIHPHVPIRDGINIHTRTFAEATITPDGHRALIEGVMTLGLTALELFLRPGRLAEIQRHFTANPG